MKNFITILRFSYVIIFCILLKQKCFSQGKIRGEFKASVGYTIAELSLDSIEKVYYLVDLFFIDSATNNKYKVIYNRESFIVSGNVCKKDLKRIKEFELHNFDRGYSNVRNDSLFDVFKVTGPSYSRNNGSNIYHISKAKTQFYIIRKETMYLRLSLPNHILCNGHVREKFPFVYVFDNRTVLPLKENEITILGFKKIEKNSIDFKICQ